MVRWTQGDSGVWEPQLVKLADTPPQLHSNRPNAWGLIHTTTCPEVVWTPAAPGDSVPQVLSMGKDHCGTARFLRGSLERRPSAVERKGSYARVRYRGNAGRSYTRFQVRALAGFPHLTTRVRRRFFYQQRRRFRIIISHGAGWDRALPHSQKQ